MSLLQQYMIISLIDAPHDVNERRKNLWIQKLENLKRHYIQERLTILTKIGHPKSYAQTVNKKVIKKAPSFGWDCNNFSSYLIDS